MRINSLRGLCSSRSPILLGALTTVFLLTACSDGGERVVRPLPPSLALASYGAVVWSTDGSTLLFNYRPLKAIREAPPGSNQFLYDFEDSLSGFWSMNLATGKMRRVGSEDLQDPTLSRDGQYIYYAGAGGNIWRYTVAGDSIDAGSNRPVTSVTTGAFGPSVSTDGNRLLYWVGSGAAAGVHLIPVISSLDRPIGPGAWMTPDWVAGDSAFVFAGGDRIPTWIGISDTIGTNPVELSNGGRDPKVSPDGQSVAFLSRTYLEASDARLWVMNRNGTGQRQLTTEPVGSRFAWSPNSTEIAYVRFDLTDNSYLNGTIWVVDVTSGAKRQVTFNPYSP